MFSVVKTDNLAALGVFGLANNNSVRHPDLYLGSGSPPSSPQILISFAVGRDRPSITLLIFQHNGLLL